MKLEVWIATDKIGSKCSAIIDVDDEELEGLDPFERNKALEEIANEEVWNMADWGYREVKED